MFDCATGSTGRGEEGGKQGDDESVDCGDGHGRGRKGKEEGNGAGWDGMEVCTLCPYPMLFMVQEVRGDSPFFVPEAENRK